MMEVLVLDVEARRAELLFGWKVMIEISDSTQPIKVQSNKGQNNRINKMEEQER